MKTSPNQDQSNGYGFAGNAPVDKRTDHAVSKKEITARCVVICFFAIMAIGVMIAMYNEPQSFPIIAYVGVALFPILAVVLLVLRLAFPNAIQAGSEKDYSEEDLFDPANMNGDAISIRESLGYISP